MLKLKILQKKVTKSESVKETNSIPRSVSSSSSSCLKKITDLTDEEKKQIIADIKAGKENEHYELKEFKNGTSRIVKKKGKTFVEKVVNNNKAKENLDTEKVFLTNDQLMNQRLIELKVKYAKLENKYKKQKKRVNDIFENIEEDVVLPPNQNLEVQEVEEKEVDKQNAEKLPVQPMKVSSLRSMRTKR